MDRTGGYEPSDAVSTTAESTNDAVKYTPLSYNGNYNRLLSD